MIFRVFFAFSSSPPLTISWNPAYIKYTTAMRATNERKYLRVSATKTSIFFFERRFPTALEATVAHPWMVQVPLLQVSICAGSV